LKLADWNLNFFNTGEWQVVQERLDDLRNQHIQYNPRRTELFRALRLTPLGGCKVAWIGQDPYPNPEDATGVAFSIPEDKKYFPPTLRNIFSEYSSDLGFSTPSNGCLDQWALRGVLLWNAYPSCLVGKPGSHHWCEWEFLTREIVEKLDGHAVLVALGRSAANFLDSVKVSPTIITSHPSPRGCTYGFMGSHLFTSINKALVEMGKEPINWRLT
jgi:uracil-DNA glycosylase